LSHILSDYYRVPEGLLGEVCAERPSGDFGFFHFGSGTICFGQCALGVSASIENAKRHEISECVSRRGSELRLTFEPAQIVENLRREQYVRNLEERRQRFVDQPLIRKTYYGIRNILPVSIRKYLQRVYLADWRKLQFPHWPVDFTADTIHEEILRLAMEASGLKRIPFVWFWPQGAPNCLIMTHDVETAPGRDFTTKLMDIDQSHGIRASFQVIPEKRYEVSEEYVRSIKRRGFEFNIHDLNHDGHLYKERGLFLRRAKQINDYARKFEARGFRAGVMYRNLDWYDAYEFSYDMSVPNVAHLDPQRGGCCTAFPFFIGKVLEIPLTTCQDYSLFQILGEYSIDLWKKQLEMIARRNGLMSFIAHPDYLVNERALAVYESLLDYLQQLVERDKVWMALPGEVDQWWRARSEMKLVQRGGDWQIVGPQQERAQLAYAILDGGRVRYEVSHDG
jgi:hypothetical protein